MAETSNYQKLITNQNWKTELSQIFVNILEKEQTALVAMNMSELMTISRQKESGVRRIKYLDEQVQEAAAALANRQPEDSAIPLSELHSFLQPEEVSELKTTSTALASLRSMIHEKNYINHAFTRDTIIYLNDAIKLISDGVATDPIYSTSGLGRATSVAPSLISMEV